MQGIRRRESVGDMEAFKLAFEAGLEAQGRELRCRVLNGAEDLLKEINILEDCGKRRRKRPILEVVTTTERLIRKREERLRRRERRRLLESGVFLHVTSRIHLQRDLLVYDEAKAILAELCRHYARVCHIELHHYCVMDNHLHLVLRLRDESRCLSRMMADVKREFTRRFKHWHNGIYRRQKRYRVQEMGNGSLWDGPYKAEVVEDMPQLGAVVFYVEANRLKVVARSLIAQWVRLGTMGAEELNDPMRTRAALEEVLLDVTRRYGFQSADFYLSGGQGHEHYLTDGMDAVWASKEEVRRYWKSRACDLPEGWRRVWYEGRKAILKPTPSEQRSYALSPLWHALGKSPECKAEVFGRLLLNACRRDQKMRSARSSIPRQTRYEDVLGLCMGVKEGVFAIA